MRSAFLRSFGFEHEGSWGWFRGRNPKPTTVILLKNVAKKSDTSDLPPGEEPLKLYFTYCILYCYTNIDRRNWKLAWKLSLA